MRLITRQLAEGHLRITVATASPQTAEEVDFLAKIEQAEALVIDFVNQRRVDGDLWSQDVGAWDVEVDPTGIPAQVQAAVLVQLGELWRFRGDDVSADEPKREPWMALHPRAEAYLRRLRDPALA